MTCRNLKRLPATTCMQREAKKKETNKKQGEGFFLEEMPFSIKIKKIEL